MRYGVQAEPDPLNEADPNAIRIVGYVVREAGLLRQASAKYWKIGYVPRSQAALITERVTAAGAAISAVLEWIADEADGPNIKVRLLAPKRFSVGVIGAPI